jgi:transcriptional regulator GlxA family with amidase domain
MGFEDCHAADVIVVPGGPGWKCIASMESLSSWLRDVHPTSTFTTSVCTGAFALGAAGILRGLHATTHCATHEHLKEYLAAPLSDRVVTNRESHPQQAGQM